MRTCLALAAILCVAFLSPVHAGGLTGQYVEARTCDVWTGACFANAEMNFAGKHAVMAWKIDKGQEGSVRLDGLSVVAVIEATDTLGMTQTGPSKAVVLVDDKADASQRLALVAVAKKLGGDLTKNVIKVESRPISIAVGGCKEGGCASVDAGDAKVTTRCIHKDNDKSCGHEDNFYPALTKGGEVKSAVVTDHTYTGKALNSTWKDTYRRGAYVGTFTVKE